jgi:peptidoglycan/LPS O-acetylase OafA/YrhL
MMPSKIESLVGVRGFAAIVVVFGHTAGALGSSAVTPGLVAAKSGVYLFFVLSAFLLTRQFLTADLTARTTPRFLSEYMFRRCARILPLYAIAIFAHYAVGFVIPGKSCVIHDAAAVFKSLLMNKGYGHFWTIPIEFIFYFILPIVALVGVGASDKRRALLAYVTFVGLSVILLDEQVDFGVAAFAYIFVSGATLALADVHFRQVIARVPSAAVSSLGLLALVAFVAIWPTLQPYGLSYSHVENLRSLWTACSCALIAACLWGAKWFRWIFENRVLRFIGAVSFSVYVWHMLVYAAVDNLANGMSAEVRHVIAWGSAIAVGWCSHRTIEMPVYRSHLLRTLWSRYAEPWITSVQVDVNTPEQSQSIRDAGFSAATGAPR